ncbi:mobilization protein [Eubacterium sp. AF15-50]|uniref:plasmid recombination protein n=1 Tax=unclassified Eubacterium (in: firmicutes) TaxID=2624479 RepID=UPI000E49E578|nr:MULTISPECIES: plasmid recombination protein [unclassified Eubacterium (in: firmicutes)]RHR72521.1 mobilization protein [Eubacterium sp. AF16-48]RHR77921.1 mobilization protein [Eubacterium sp. AF15-50]
MERLSYSAHLSQKNSAINSKAKLACVAKHNLRKYHSNDYDKENIVILCGTDKLVQDVKKVYKEQFDEAVREYNKKQTRDDRKIDDYFEKTAKSNKDMAVELIFQIGDKEFWDKNPDKRRRMDVAFKEMLNMLQKEAPNLVVANAVIHYDEASPHMHVVAVPVADGFKKGISRQVSKRKVCTKEFLEEVLQGKIRECVDNRIFVWLGEFLKSKQTGRNNDLSVVEYKVKKENEKYEKAVKNVEVMNNEILKKTAEKQRADKKLEETYKELKEADAVAQWGIKDIRKFENKVIKGPEEPKGLMSAKSYREKIVMPFIAGLNRIFKRIVKMAKSCFAESMELKKKLGQANEDRERLAEANENLRRRVKCMDQEIDEKAERIYELEGTEFILEYFRKFVKDEDYERIVEMGKEERENGHIQMHI